MANDSTNVSTGKPMATGAIFVSPVGTEPPADATTALDAEVFKGLGYISEDGVTQTEDLDVTDFNAWGGDVVATSRGARTEEYQFTLIETNVESLKQAYGEDNVTGDWETGITVRHNNKEKAEYVYVIETIMTGNRVGRTVIPRGKVMELGDVVKKDDELIGYEVTVKALAYAAWDGDTSRDFFATVSGSQAASDGGDTGGDTGSDTGDGE